jgi:hypothetical protein
MNSFMNMVKIKNPDQEYPSNMGQKWSDEEETLLLEELSKNIDVETISKKHGRTVGGIHSRCREIAYKMYLKNVSMEEIIKQTKLDEESIMQAIKRRKHNNTQEIKQPKQTNNTQKIKQPTSIEHDIAEIKNEIKELKNTIKELVEMMKAVYVFEDA